MNRSERGEPAAPKTASEPSGSNPEETSSSGPSLVGMYIALAAFLAAAIGFAILIVMPYYRRIGH
ncbi:MAG: hypothetical protein ACLGP3_12545 [Acidobacteriota bacterium]